MRFRWSTGHVPLADGPRLRSLSHPPAHLTLSTRHLFENPQHGQTNTGFSAETATAALLKFARPTALHKRFSKRHMAHAAFQRRTSAPPYANGCLPSGPSRTPTNMFSCDSIVQHQVAKTSISQINMLKAPTALGFSFSPSSLLSLCWRFFP
jgi:hypothetical protein